MTNTRSNSTIPHIPSHIPSAPLLTVSLLSPRLYSECIRMLAQCSLPIYIAYCHWTRLSLSDIIRINIDESHKPHLTIIRVLSAFERFILWFGIEPQKNCFFEVLEHQNEWLQKSDGYIIWMDLNPIYIMKQIKADTTNKKKSPKAASGIPHKFWIVNHRFLRLQSADILKCLESDFKSKTVAWTC